MKCIIKPTVQFLRTSVSHDMINLFPHTGNKKRGGSWRPLDGHSDAKHACIKMPHSLSTATFPEKNYIDQILIARTDKT